ncbi:MAG TPA: immunoglobulin domain-containing protein [Verrucomicrobiae bacterium]|jgi:hypothetical protein
MKTNSIESIRKLIGSLAVFTAIILTAVSARAAGSSSLVIAEVYGGGGNSGATYKNDFIVVFNRGTSNVDVNGWSVQYASATATSSWAGETTLATSSTIIPPGGYFLVQESAGTGGATSLPTPDSTGTLAISATAGKVALCNNNTLLNGQFANGMGSTIVDFVGFGATANGFEGSGPTPAPSNTTSVQRNNSGCTDTDNNTNDFTAGSPDPRNSATTTHSCAVITPPVISGILPSSLATNAGNNASFTVTLSQGDAPLNYFWYKETASSTNLISNVTSSASTNTLTLPNVLFPDAANYQAVVSNASTLTVTSDIVSLSVTDPAINVQPVSQTGLLGGAAQFPVSAGGTGLGYRWYFCADPGDNTQISGQVNNGTLGSGAGISGATTSALTITNLTTADPTNFVVVVTGTYGSVTSSVASLAVANTAPLAFWNFNNPYLNITNPAPYQGIGTASSTNVQTFQSPTSDANDPGSPVSAWGTQNYPAQGTLNTNAGVQFNVSTVGAKDIVVSYDVRGSATASEYQRLQFTTNGTTWIDYPASSTLNGSTTFQGPRVQSLAGFPGVANNPNFGIRIVAEFESTARYNDTNNANYAAVTPTSAYGASGTLTYDLVTISADAITNNNAPPTISSIPDQTMNDTIGTTIVFTVSDDSTPAGSLGVTAVSLDPNVSLSITPQNTGGTVHLSINSSLYNTATNFVPVLVTVTDANGDVSSTWFTLAIAPQNSPPVFTGLINTNMLPNGVLVIPFKLTDDKTDPNTITPAVLSGNTTLVSNDVAHVSLGGSGTNRTLTITPVTNQLGTVPITVSANDGSLDSSQTIFLTVRPNTNVVLIDNFDYDGSGALDLLSEGFWVDHSGTANQLLVGSGQITVDNVHNSEDVNAPLIGQPYLTNSAAVLYSKMTIQFTTLPDATGAYFAHFKDNTTFGFFGRVWASSNSPTTYRIGIGNSSGATATTAPLPQDLVLNSNYTVVTRLIMTNGLCTVWVNPVNESSSPSVTAGDSTNSVGIVTNLDNVYAYAFRESNTSGGIVNVSNLVVGTSFNDVVGVTPAATLNIQLINNQAVLTWSDASFSLQSSTNVTGPYSTIGAAHSPSYTNSIASPATFYRLMHP